MNPIKSILNRKIESKDIKIDLAAPVYIYGAGSVGRELVKLLVDKGVEIPAIIDQRGSTIGEINGIKVLDMQEFRRRKESTRGCTLLISLFNHYVDCAEISSGMKQDFDTIYSFPKVQWFFQNQMPGRYWLTNPEFYDDHASNIEKAFSMLSDQRSKDIFLNNLEFRLLGDYENLLPPDLTDQYFSRDLPRWCEPLRLIDCGAYTGDTILQVAGFQYKMEAVAAFEPDCNNFKSLVTSLNQLSFRNPECKERILLPCGASNETAILSFTSGLGVASNINTEGDVKVQGVAIDDALPDFRPNLIKMDIEGGELDALKGCRRTIEQYRPGLSISAYHKPDDLWTIPLLIGEMLSNTGRLSLRTHCHNGFDLLYYWHP